MKNREQILKNIKTIVFDLDGTLLNKKTDITNKTIDSIHKLSLKGYHFIVASGRIYPMLESYVKRIGKIDYVISANGASIDDVLENKRLKKIYVDSNEAKQIYEFCQENKIECLILKRDVSYFPKDSYRLNKFLSYNEISIQNGYEPMKLEFYPDDFNAFNEVEKILIHEKNQESVDKLIHFIDSHTDLKYTKSDQFLLDISSQGVSKEEALKYLCEEKKIDLDQVLIFGDYDNDVGMMDIAGYAIAPKNASNKALSSADEITLSNDEDGVAFILDKLIEMGNENEN
jgi:Cof subfamily protein (haloacid dehalogenase superfamily)